MFNTFPREIGFPVRRLVLTKQDFYSLINKYINIVNLYTSVYKFKVISKGRPVYDSAVIDKVFVDIDKENEYDKLLDIHEYLTKKDIKHTIFFSGRGFHLYVFTKILDIPEGWVKKQALVNYIESELGEKFGLQVDKVCVGDLARLTRIPNTFNFKRRRFCIPLDDKLLYSGYNYIRQCALKQKFDYNIWGAKEIDLMKWVKDVEMLNTSNILTKSDYIQQTYSVIKEGCEEFDFLPDFPPFLDKIISRKKESWNKELGWRERALIIIWLKEHTFTLQQTIAFLRKILTKEEFIHCVMEERQPYYIYRRDKTPNPYHFPNMQTLMNNGFDLTEEDINFFRRYKLYEE